MKSMFSPEFERVYREAFISATGRDFHDDETYRKYIEDTSDALLHRWASPDFDPSPITDITDAKIMRSFWIKHPSTHEFDKVDAHNIARVRYFGQATITAAQNALRDNPHISPDDPERFYVRKWRTEHPKEEERDDQAFDPYAPSPLRLRRWPKGDFINCLGISIATAAESANYRQPYVYMNRIRNSLGESSKESYRFLERIASIAPYAVELDKGLHRVDYVLAQLNGVHDSKKLDDTMKCVFDHERLGIIEYYADSFDTAFHHAVVRYEPDPAMPYTLQAWRQIDPYGLVSDSLPLGLDIRMNSDGFTFEDPGRCNEILLLDNNVKHLSMQLGRLIDIAFRGRNRLRNILDDYKSPDMMQRVKKELKKIQNAIHYSAFFNGLPINNISDEELFEQETCFTNNEECIRESEVIWLETLIASVWTDHARAAYRQTLGEDFERHIKSARYTADRFAANLHEVIRHDKVTRDQFGFIIESMPFALVLHAGEKNIQYSVFSGEADKTMEIADPAFMVGSMYLNHYARWREDGTINVAKELARINPSQLIWQAAVSLERKPIADRRVIALGRLVKSLKIGQQHPLVRMTRPAKE